MKRRIGISIRSYKNLDVMLKKTAQRVNQQ